MINIREIRIGDIITKEISTKAINTLSLKVLTISAVRFVIERYMKMEVGRWQYLHTKICRRFLYQ